MNLGAISDPQQRARLKGGSQQQQRDYRDLTLAMTPPNFLVTQSLVCLLTEKGVRYRYSGARIEQELKGVSRISQHWLDGFQPPF